ncbi:MAG: enoyl-CoA hydratase/isomerase family protein [Dichotomicrobium sp.]
MPSSPEDARADTPAPEVICTEDNRAGIIVLNRPKALNALSRDMIGEMEAHFHAWAKNPHIYGVIQRARGDGAFCAGGDVKAIYAQRGTDPAAGARFYREEYQHNWTLQRFIKPTVSLMNGIVMGGGVGISVHGTHRVAAEGYKLAMPETAIGLFPDIGASYFLPRLPGRTGLYLGLTGAVVGPADGYRLGLATHCISADRFDEIQDAMREAEPIDPVLDDLHVDPGAGELDPLRPAIDRCFAPGSIEDILARLTAESGDTAQWAQETAQTLRACSPTSLKLALRLYEEGARANSLKDSLKLEFRCAVRCLEAHDHYEGVRAKMIDKDNDPHWQPARLEDVTAAMIESYLAPLEDIPELDLTDHWNLVE